MDLRVFTFYRDETSDVKSAKQSAIYALFCDIEVVSEHDVKSVRVRSYSGSYFLAFGLNTGKYGPE